MTCGCIRLLDVLVIDCMVARSTTPVFNSSWECPRMHVWYKFGDSSPNLWWVVTWTRHNPWNSELKWPKLPWRAWSMNLLFNSSWVSNEACLVQIWRFYESSSNLWRVLMWTKESLRTDRQDRRRQQQYPLGLKVQWVKIRAANLWKLTSVTICNNFKIFSNISPNFSIFTR